MSQNKVGRQSPVWLQPLWERKRAETVRRVTAAVRSLKRQGKIVTLAGIRETIRELEGVSISTNTIQRNELAYQFYRQHAAPIPAKSTSRSRALAALQERAPDAQRPALRATIARLRRQSKDALVARILELETTVENQGKRENALRGELLRITLKTAQ